MKDLKVVSKNLMGNRGFFELDGNTRDLRKLEQLALNLENWGVDIYLVQETWLLGDWERQLYGCTMFDKPAKQC